MPFYSGLSIEQILDFGGKYVDVQNAFPDKKETLKFERAYICNVIHSLVGEDFQQWVDDRVNARNKKVTVEGNKIIELDPIIAAVFLNSSAISTTNGRSFSMLKVGSKRRRTISQIDADILNGNAKAAETTEAINKLNRVIA